MSTPSNFDNERRQREWEAQEYAVREERRGVEAANDNARVMQYRLVVRALRHPPIDPLPGDFAHRTAERIELLANAADERFEIRLQQGLIALLAIASVVAVLYFGNAWWRAFTLSIQQSAELGLATIANWSVVVAACLGLSWVIERWRQQA